MTMLLVVTFIGDAKLGGVIVMAHRRKYSSGGRLAVKVRRSV